MILIRQMPRKGPLIVKWVIGSVFCGIFVVSSYADVSYKSGARDKLAHITISEHIKKEDLENFRTFARMALNSESDFYQVNLDCYGGDVETSLSIGRIIRDDKAIVAIHKDCQCLSSCVFLLAGGAHRFVQGTVGIHRPFSPIDLRKTTKEQKQYYEKIEKNVKKYLTDMNIPNELYDHMFRVPPPNIKILTKTELQRYGLSESDPYEYEANNARISEYLGITKEEFIRRINLAEEFCSISDRKKNIDCYMSIISTGEKP